MPIIKRRIEEKLKKRFSYFPVVGILGPRQAGKTTLVKAFISQLDTPFTYLDLERPSDLQKISDPELYFNQHLESCVVLDEVQRAPDLFPVLRSMIDLQRRPGRFLVLGSASQDLIRDSSESLAGRIAYLSLDPFNLLEIHEPGIWLKHWFRGGFPDAFLAPDDELASLWLENFVQTYIERDLPMLGLSASPTLTRNLWTMLAHYHGNLWNASQFASALAISRSVLNRYVQFLSEAFLIRQLLPYAANVKKRLVKSPKVYVRDSGILHHLTGIRDVEHLQGQAWVGASWEGYVVEQITQQLEDRIEPYFYRTQAGAEIDLLLVASGKPLAALEIKFANAPNISRGFYSGIEDLGTLYNFVITPDSDDFLIQKNIRVCKLYDFLEKHLPAIQSPTSP